MSVLKWFAGVLAVVAVVFTVNTLRFTTEKIILQPRLDASEIDKMAVAGRLSKGIQFATISHMVSGLNNAQAFKDFHLFLTQAFPKKHAALEL